MKKQLLLLLVLLSAPTVTAQEINVQALQACSFIENDFNRLLCYDNTVAGKPLTKPSEKKTLTPPKPVANITPNVSAPVAAVTASAPAAKGDDFGLEHKEITKDKDENITALVSSVKKAPYGELIISLDNSQEWRQIGSDSLKLKKSDTVVISRGVFNSFLLRKDGQNRSIRVKRTQ
ncbi:hypothetical protein [Pseudoalteromonas carrageenovora]|uniref:hypothetical protein n=1 Tax=Pseudoalteromonas carrageenovora TaxID=227 RepID=UPI0026E3B4B1|nr:hypothetical protein [Pseudoalteromonas carrageenovora]MDO6465498.1 hypothetical protein [Pseudoalteromonas carrageenovora]